MDHWKNELKKGFEAPAPVTKREFLRQLNLPGMSLPAFLCSQIGYIRKWVWCTSVAVLALAVFGLLFLPETVIWMISGLTPLLALTMVSESGRSRLYQMEELEMATRFSLRSVILARLAILGVANFLLLMVLLVLGAWNSQLSPLRVSLYIVTPYLLTTFTGLSIVRRFRGQEGLFTCVGAAVSISVFLLLSHNVLPFLYAQHFVPVWTAAALMLFWGNGKQCAAMINRTEDAVWN